MPVYAFVSEISDSPDILLDLNDKSPFGVAVGARTPPPTLRYSSFGSSARDGDVVTQSSYNDRVLSLPLRVEFGTTPEQQVEAIQKLGRLLNAPQWLMWWHDGMIEPVFFRTRRADMDVVDDFMTEVNPQRSVTLTIPAEPFAYGLSQSGSFEIPRDMSGSSAFSHVWPDVQGDVATNAVLKLSSGFGLDGDSASAHVASTALPIGRGMVAGVQPSPNFFWTTTTGWSDTSGSDSTAQGGTFKGYTRSSGVTSKRLNNVLLVTVAEPGDYRLLIRVRASSPSTSSVTASLSTDVPGTTRSIPNTSWTWVDFGVWRGPTGSARIGSALSESFITSRSGSLAATITVNNTGTGSVDIDAAVAIPLNLDGGLAGRFLDARFVTRPPSQIVFDGDSASIRRADGSLPSGIAVAGGFPTLVPGADNTLTVVPGASAAHPDSEPLSGTMPVSWYYFPRYLYVRPATT